MTAVGVVSAPGGSSPDSVLDLVNSDMKLDLESCLAVRGEADLCSGVTVEHGLAACKQNMDTSVDNDYANLNVLSTPSLHYIHRVR